jgi:hypothetical protein
MGSLAGFESCNENFLFAGGKGNPMKSLKLTALVSIAILALAGTMVAQGPPDPVPMVAGAMQLPDKGAMLGMHLENNMDTAPVKGAPFCATVATDHTQSFADGNRIHTTENSTLCRDSEGRIRRDASLNLLGASPQASATKLITILDPVAGVRYMLDSENKVAHKMTLLAPGGASDPGLPPRGGQTFIMRSAGGGEGPGFSTNINVMYKKPGQDSDEPTPATENLGDQTINGIHATGTRMTTTIPSGKMGNDKPIVVTSERWYSSDLKATVMTKHDDPWAGELKTEFTNVNTAEPDPSLFTVPGDYKIVDDKNGPVTIRMVAPAPPAR